MPGEHLHGLDEVREALGAQRPVVIVGSASTADMLQGLSIPAAGLVGTVGVEELDKVAVELKGGDIILLRDSDPAFYAQCQVLMHSLSGVARQVRLIDAAVEWAAGPANATVADWVTKENIDAQKLYHIADRTAPLYREEERPYQNDIAQDDARNDTRFQIEYATHFGALPWYEMQRRDTAHYEYIIQGLIPKEEMVLIYGESQSGKSFFTFDMAIHLAAGYDYQSREVERMGVVWVAAEKGKGARLRMMAFRKFHDLPLNEFPFVVLTKPVDLFTDEKTVDQLIVEIQHLVQSWRKFNIRLGAVVIDTHDAATPGASEIQKEAVTLIKKRYTKIMTALHCGLWIVHHENMGGEIRGSRVLFNAIETVIHIQKVREGQATKLQPAKEVKDMDGRLVRRATVRKQSEGEAGANWQFVLQQVDIGEKDRYGMPVTSCVVRPPHMGEQQDMTGLRIEGNARAIFKCLLEALEKHGEQAGADLRCPRGTRVVDRVSWRDIYDRTTADMEPDKEKRAARVKVAMQRAIRKFQELNLVGVDNIGARQWVWWTGRPVTGFDKTLARHEAPAEQTELPAIDDDRPPF